MKEEKTILIKPKKEKRNNNDKENKNWQFIAPIIMLILGIILLTNSTKAVIIVCYAIGIIITIIGIYHLIGYFNLRKELKIDDNKKLILGIGAIFIGITIMILAGVLETCLRFIIGFSLLYNGLRKAIIAINFRNSFNLLIGIIFMAMGLYTILAENIVFQIVGILLIISSIMDLITYIKDKKNKA